MKSIMVMLILLAVHTAAEAAFLLSDTFAYPDGVLTNNSNGKWRHAAGGFNEVNVAGDRVELTRTETEDVECALSTSFSSSSGVTLYSKFSLFVFSPPKTANGGYFAHLGSSARVRVFVVTNGAAPGRFRLGIANGSSTTSNIWPSDLYTNQLYTVMTRWVITNAQATLWVNPLSSSDLSISATDVVTPASASVFAWRQDAGIGSLAVDDLLVGTVFEEVLSGEEAPAISTIGDQLVPDGGSTLPIPFVVGDLESPADVLTVSAFASDSNLVQSILFDGFESNRTVTVTTPPNQTGTTTITILVSDGILTNRESFLLTVLPALLFADDFSYPDGALITNGAPTWVRHGGGTGEIQVVSGSVSMSVPYTEDVSAWLPYNPFLANSGLSLYASFILNCSVRPGSGDYIAHFNSTGGRCRVFLNTLNAAPGKFRLGIANGASDMIAQFPMDLATHTNHLVVMRYNLNTGISTLWVNPNAETSPSTNATDVASIGAVTMFAFRESASIGTFTIDGLRVGLSFPGLTTPRLRIEREPDGYVRLAWPSSSPAVLQFNSDLPSPFWEDILDPPTVTNGENVLIHVPVSSPTFYRLRR